MKSLNELLKKKKSLHEDKDKQIIDFNRSLKNIDAEIKETESVISAYFQEGNKIGTAKQLVSLVADDDEPTATLVTLEKFKDILLDGRMQAIINGRNNISYWYNSGFRDGHARRMTRGYGEDHATCLVNISFKRNVYDDNYQLSDEDIIALSEWVNSEIGKLETKNDW